MDKSITQPLRGVLVLMVVLQHLVFAVAESWYASSLNSLFMVFRGDVAVGILMFLSGYILIPVIQGKLEQNKGFLRLMLKRLARLLVPMAGIYVILYFVFLFGWGDWGRNLVSMGYEWGYLVPIGMIHELTAYDLLVSFTGQLLGFNDQILLVAWLVKFEVLGSLILLTVLALCFKMGWGKKMMLAFLVLAAILAQLMSNTGGVLTSFMFGAVLSVMSSYNWPRKILHDKRLLVLISLSAYSMVLMSLVNGEQWKIDQIASGNAWMIYLMSDARYVLYSMLLPIFWFVVKQIAKIGNLGSMLTWLGDRSYSVYLVSQIAIMILAMLVAKVQVYLPPPLFIAASLFVSFVLADVFYKYVEQPVINMSFKKFWRFIRRDTACA